MQPATDCAIKILRAITEVSRRLHPELGLSFGYIGNLENRPARDDRQWSVFTNLSSRPDATACNVSWGRAATADLGTLAVSAALGDVFDWTDRQAVLLRDGKLFQVSPGSWLELERAYAADWPHRTHAVAGR